MGHPLPTNDENILAGSGQVTELWRHKSNNIRPIFHGNRDFSNVTCCRWLEWRHYAWFRSENVHIWSSTLHLDLSKVIRIRGHWPWPTPYYLWWLNWYFRDFLRSWGQICGSFFYIDLLLWSFYRFGCQSGLFTQFALGRFIRWGHYDIPLPGCYTSQIFGQYAETARRSAQNWMENT